MSVTFFCNLDPGVALLKSFEMKKTLEEDLGICKWMSLVMLGNFKVFPVSPLLFMSGIGEWEGL